jgi:hypothetical protein
MTNVKDHSRENRGSAGENQSGRKQAETAPAATKRGRMQGENQPHMQARRASRGTIPLTDEQFKTFLLKTTANDYGKRILAAVIADSAEPAAENCAAVVARGGETPAPNPAGAESASVAAVTAKAPEAAKQSAVG